MLRIEALYLPEGELIYLPETTSTMDVAAQKAREGAPHLTTVIADFQTQGRGRQGKVWTDLAECNLAMTLIIRIGAEPTLPLVASLAVAQALQTCVDAEADVTIKWPNDLHLKGLKVAGILVEKQEDWALLGIGINVKTPPEEIRQQLIAQDFPGIFLEEASATPLTREAVANAVVTQVQQWTAKVAKHGWPVAAKEYEKLCNTLGQHVTWRREGATGLEDLSGIAQSITAEGTLELVSEDGQVHTITAGEIVAQGRSH